MRHTIENILLAYARWFPLHACKYRIIELYGHTLHASRVRRARLKYGNYLMDCDLRKMLQRQFYFFGTYFLERRVINQWSQRAQDAAIVFNIGANAGIYSLAAAASNPLARIYAFEPTPDITVHLRETVSLNQLGDRFSVEQCAVARVTGTAYLNFFLGEHNDNEGQNFVSQAGRNSSSVAVSTVSLDDFCSNHQISCVDLVKIDVQGHEPEVLEGASGLIQRHALRTIFFELNWNHADPSQCSASKAVKILADAGYQFADPNGHMQFQAAGAWLHALSDVVALLAHSRR